MKTYKELVEGITETLSLLEEVEGLDEDLGKHLAHAVNHLAIAQIGDVSRPSRNMKKYNDAVEKVRQSHGEQAAKDFHHHAHMDAYELHGSGAGDRATQFHKHMSSDEKKSYDKHFNKLLGEEVEGLDELSEPTVRNYYNKAGEQGKKIADKMKMGGGDWSKDGSDTKTLKKRAAGRTMALKRRSGEIKMSEDTDLEEGRMKDLATDMESLSHADFKRKHRRTKQEMQSSLKSEELKGNQHKIDANKNGKVDGHDFKILRNQKKARYQ